MTEGGGINYYFPLLSSLKMFTTKSETDGHVNKTIRRRKWARHVGPPCQASLVLGKKMLNESLIVLGFKSSLFNKKKFIL